MTLLSGSLLILATIMGAAAGDAVPVAEPALRLDLPDQYGGRLRFPADSVTPRVTLVVVADRRGAPANQAWAEALGARYRDHLDRRREPWLVIFPVAHLEPVPWLLRGVVRRSFRKRQSDGKPLLPIGLDWHGEARRQLGLVPGVPNLTVLDIRARIRLQCAGSVGDAGDAVFALLDSLLTANGDDVAGVSGKSLIRRPLIRSPGRIRDRRPPGPRASPVRSRW